MAHADVQALTREGRHEEAADLLLSRGDARGAAELLATVWSYARAVAVASRAGLYVEAYRHALTSKDKALEHQALGDLLLDPASAREAAPLAAAKGRLGDAARLAAAAGELADAAQRFEEAGELFSAAELRERAGDAKAAGRLYERHLAEHGDDARAALALGRILLRFGRAEPAAAALQRIAGDSEHGPSASRLLILAFDRLGLSDAATAVLDGLRRGDPSLPPTVAAFLASQGAPASSSEETSLVLGRYRIKRTLGAGGTGRVLLAEDTFFAKDVAIKVLSAVEGARGRDALVRFAREARLSATLEHPNVVRALDYHGAGPYLVMELMTGGTLEDRLFPSGAPKDGPMTPLAPAVGRHVLTSVLRALDAAHRRGVVHRDIKPGNVFFGSAGEVKLGDFGAAHLLDVGATRTGALIGTVAYMAPEQIVSASAIHPATDLYAVGVLTYAALLGALPFPGPDFLEQHLHATPRSPSELSPAWLRAVPEGLAALDRLAAQLLDKSPEGRPESALAVEHALDRLPFAAWQLAYESSAGASVAIARPTSVPPPPMSAGRYLELESPSGGPRRAHDELLDRDVELVALDAAARAHLVRFAKVSSPHLQAIYGEEEGLLVLEALPPPSGAPLDARALAEIEQALDALHRLGLVHGAIERDAIAITPVGAVLRLPLTPTGGPPAADRAAVDRLR